MKPIVWLCDNPECDFTWRPNADLRRLTSPTQCPKCRFPVYGYAVDPRRWQQFLAREDTPKLRRRRQASRDGRLVREP